MQVKVWDIAVRLFHWALAVAFCFSVFSAFQDKFGLYATMHTYAGLGILVLVSWRILWGLIGSDTARFSQFLMGPKAIMAYLRGEGWSGVGHNPLGALSVVLMLLLLLVQAVMGLFATDDMFFEGPLASRVGDLAGEITELHEWLGYILMGLVGLHLLVVLWYALVRKMSLIWPMISGTKQLDKTVPAPHLRPAWLAFFLLVPVAVAVWYYLLP